MSKAGKPGQRWGKCTSGCPGLQRVPEGAQHDAYVEWGVFFQFSSVAQMCPTLCDPIECSTPGFPVYHQLLELAQTHVH